MPLLPGTIVAGNIRLERMLGMGGMGSVWSAEHVTLKTRVAVKFMSPEIAQRPDARERFEREASAAAQIRSPHVVQVSDHGITADGLPYIVMELLEGEDLDDRLDRLTILDVPSIVEIVGQTCRALASAHAKGIVHRDIKPENIYLVRTDDGEPFVKLLDFGIAKQILGEVTRMTTTGSMAGTPHYMSPEQVISFKDVDHRTDLWSLAVVTYRALTGQVPFDAQTLAALGVAIHTAVFVPPSQHRPDLPPLIDVWMARALARNRDDRFSSAREMADELRVAAGMPRLTSLRDFGPSTLVRSGPSSPTRMDATLPRASYPPPGAQVSTLWKAVLFVLVTIGSVAAFLLVRAAVEHTREVEVQAVTPPTVVPAAAPNAAERPLPSPAATKAEDAGSQAVEPEPRTQTPRTLVKPKPSGATSARPGQREPEDYGF